MADFYIDPDTNDLAWPVRLATGLELTRQRIRYRLRLHLGEWFLDTRRGIDFLGWRQHKPPRVPEIVAELRTVVGTTPGVLGTREWSGVFDRDTRHLSISGEYLVADRIETRIESLGIAFDSVTRGNVTLWPIYFGTGQRIHQPPAGPTGETFDFGVVRG